MSTTELVKLKKGGQILLERDYLDEEYASELFQHLLTTMPWKKSDLMLYGKPCKTPRFQCWMADEDVKPEVYADNRVDWDPEMLKLKKRLEKKLQSRSRSGASGSGEINFKFDYLLLNYYATGADYIGFHSDQEVVKDKDLIASVSLGGTRRFLVKEWPKPWNETYEFELQHGDLMVMDGLMQRGYKHSVPKTAKYVDPRINLTFRKT